ncbi:MAG: MarR family transcriptional regulator [Zoogloeaceae bacterium]|jgi:DNA-binding MarR family transcriptional regulator|nr:MarR family transcriptional regulator [Zoogloeaceae bacterium]
MPAAPDAMDVLKQFRAVFSAVKQHFQQVESTCQVSGAQLWALAVVARQPGLRVSELARAMAVHQSTASNLVDRLVELNLIRKDRSRHDRRVVHLTPAPRGVELIEKAPQPLEGALPGALSKLSPEELGQLHGLLKRLLLILKTGRVSLALSGEKGVAPPKIRDAGLIPLADLVAPALLPPAAVRSFSRPSGAKK